MKTHSWAELQLAQWVNAPMRGQKNKSIFSSVLLNGGENILRHLKSGDECLAWLCLCGHG